jgi:hypothetical protein
MRRRRTVKYIHEGRYVAAVSIELIRDETAWSPYLTLEDACKLDEARGALRRGDLTTASAYGRVYELRPVDQSSGDRIEGGTDSAGVFD